MSMTNQETDTALILENELKRRVSEVVSQIVYQEVRRQMSEVFTEQKGNMMMEISLNVGKMLRVIEEEGRNPLWVSGPQAVKDFNIGDDVLNQHMIEGGKNAVRKQTPSV